MKHISRGAISRRILVGVVAACAATPGPSSGQTDTLPAQDGIFARPFIGQVSSTSIGGYLEGNTNYFVEDGVGEGFSMELRRFNIFLFSNISSRVRFLSELEFEHGTEEIALETALIDFLVDPALVLRAGVLLPPLGYLNQNHDSPRWDWVDRPLVTTDVIPSTLSEVGGGAYGKFFLGSATLSYDLYLVNGLQDGIIDNEHGRTDVASGRSEELLAEDNNGSPSLTGRVALHDRRLGEIGASYYGGYYNSFRLEGEDVDDRRWLGIAALDLATKLGPIDVRSELAYVSLDVPEGMEEVFGEGQWGGYLDLLAAVWRPTVLGYQDPVVSVGLRLERVDYNTGTFESTGEPIRDEVTAIVPTLSFRPASGTVFRVNYRYHWIRDFVGNPTARMAGFQLGFATYF